MRHLDLFSGIGGFALAASWVWGAEHEIHSFVEIEPFCQKVLKKHWPDVPIHDDIRTYKHDGTAIDLLTGGFPCQPFSLAGKRRGAEDDRALWPSMLEVIQASRPTWIIGENVAGIINMELDNYISDLEDEGYECQAFVVPACSVDAIHIRKRVWVVAHTFGDGLEGGCVRRSDNQKNGASEGCEASRTNSQVVFAADTDSAIKPLCREDRRVGREESFSWIKNRDFSCEPFLGGGNNGLPNRLDRLKSLGNAIVPQVVVPIMKCIKLISEQCQ